MCRVIRVCDATLKFCWLHDNIPSDVPAEASRVLYESVRGIMGRESVDRVTGLGQDAMVFNSV